MQFGASGQWGYNTSTIGMTTGKWYVEVKCGAIGGEAFIGMMTEDDINLNQVSGGSGRDWVGKGTDAIGYGQGGNIQKSGSDVETGVSAYSTNNIIGMALDLDSNTFQFYEDGASRGSAVAVTAGKTYFFAASGYSDTIWQFNFGGSPAFTISSGNADANGYGNFEFPPPTGFYALCSQNLAEFG